VCGVELGFRARGVADGVCGTSVEARRTAGGVRGTAGWAGGVRGTADWAAGARGVAAGALGVSEFHFSIY